MTHEIRFFPKTEVFMQRDPTTTTRLRAMLQKILLLTKDGKLHWKRQEGSAHRFATWNSNLLIIGPTDPVEESNIPRYLFVTPLDSPTHVEINSNDEELGQQLLELTQAVENTTRGSTPIDPFSLTDDVLTRLNH
ncbi:MAG TPA: hypothetical protein VFD63_03755 [Pyrinomonadaceae bacterium]|jgi:hypothetical protein|nr:hypothetical protein [Pyrinomonadaceae bacterium]